MNEQIQTIIDRARVLLADATPGPLAVGVGEVETEDAGRHRAVLIHTDAYCVAACGSPGEPHSHADADALAFAVNNIGTLCDALVDAERRAAETDAQAAAMREALVEIGREWTIDEDGCAFCGDGLDGDHDGCPGMIASKALANPAGRALLDRMHAAETRVADLESVREDQAAKLRRHLDEIAEMGALHSVAEARERRLERELLAVWATVRPDNPAPTTERDVLHAVEDVQSDAVSLRAIIADCAAAIGNGSACSKDASVEFMAMIPAEIHAEIVALRDRAGIAEGREACAKANAAEMAGRLDAQNAGLVQMARDRDAALAEIECLKAQRDVARQDARRAENERDAIRDEAGPRLTVAELQRESYETARAKGWHDEDETPPSPIRVIAWMGLICSEAAEAIEDARKGRMVTTIREDGKPEGLGSELADIVIRVCDSAGAMGVDMEAELRAKLAFNRTRGHRHGGKLA